MSQIIKNLMVAASHAPSADNSQPWRFLCERDTISIAYDAVRVDGITFPSSNPATLLAIGGALENTLQAAEFLGLEANVEFYPQADNESLYATLSFHDPFRNKHDVSLENHPLFKRHTNRFPYQSQTLSLQTATEVTEHVQGKSQLRFLSDPGDIKSIAYLAKIASEIRFQTQEVHEWLAHSLRFTKKEVSAGDGLDLATIPLPPGGTLFMRFIMDWKWMSLLNRLGTYKLMATLDVKLLTKAPAVIALIGGSTPKDIIEAGRLLTRVWIDLNSRGIAVQPYYVVSDQLQRRLEGKVPPHLLCQVDKLNEQIVTQFNLSTSQRLHILLRIGYSTKDPVRSKRLPIDRVCH